MEKLLVSVSSDVSMRENAQPKTNHNLRGDSLEGQLFLRERQNQLEIVYFNDNRTSF